LACIDSAAARLQTDAAAAAADAAGGGEHQATAQPMIKPFADNWPSPPSCC